MKCWSKVEKELEKIEREEQKGSREYLLKKMGILDCYLQNVYGNRVSECRKDADLHKTIAQGMFDKLATEYVNTYVMQGRETLEEVVRV